MKCELLEGISSFLMAVFFCCLLILPATIVGCANEESTVAPSSEVDTTPDVQVDTPNAHVEVGQGEDPDVDVNVEAEPAGEPAVP